MVEFYAKYKTKTKRPISFKTSTGKRVRFKAKRTSERKKKIKFQSIADILKEVMIDYPLYTYIKEQTTAFFFKN